MAYAQMLRELFPDINLLDDYKLDSDSHKIHKLSQEALWEIADLIIYNKHPELYDRATRIQWDFSEISSIISLDGKTVADIGAGSGRIAFLVAPHVQTVFAVEPLKSFRAFMKEKAANQKAHNLFAMDGILDVLITSNALGWNIHEELKEIERVVKPGGTVIHLLHTDLQQENPYHKILTSASGQTSCS